MKICNFKNKQKSKGFAMVEVMVALLLMSFLGMAAGFSYTKLAKAQTESTIYSLLSAKIKNNVSEAKVLARCIQDGEVEEVSEYAITEDLVFTDTKKCEMVEMEINIENDRAVVVRVPEVYYELDNQEFNGDYPFIVKN